ncbi:MAG: (Fe-S)-binding protein [Pseudomonas sp.]|uniref:(Fe-S)-binding protein n=1 Tax=Pseudomonas sp. TaxID=306 RepID=UPI0039820DEA
MITSQPLAERHDFLARCTRCSQCKFVPTIKSQRHASACPSMDYGQFHAFSGGGQLIMGYGLLSGDVDCSEELERAVSSCTMCGNCDISCKVNFAETVEPLDSLYALRAKLVTDGHSPAAHVRTMENIRATGNPEGHPRVDRGNWALGLTLTARDSAPEVMLHIGSQLAYDPERWRSLRAVIESLEASGVALAHLGGSEGPSGGLAFDLGYVDDAKAFAQQMVEQVASSGALTLVTFSASALAAFRAIYPRLGLSFKHIRVLHYTEYLQELVHDRRLRIRPQQHASNNRVAYHDACKLGRLSEPWQPRDLQLDNQMGGILTSRAVQKLRFGHGGCYDAPRALLGQLGFEVVELERNRGSSYCCGAAGGVVQAQPEAAKLAAANRLAELRDANTSTLVSGCQGCTCHLGRNAADDVQVRDLIDLLADALEPVPAEPR